MTRRAGWVLGAAVLAAAGAPAEGADPVGRTCWRGGNWFQDLGLDGSGRQVWLYPHLDGVPELFVAPAGGGPWQGSLGSSYDPAAGAFTRRFNAAAVADELAAPQSSAERRRRAATSLATFARLHPAGAPYYLRPLEESLAAALDEAARAEVTARVERHRALVSRVAEAGTRVLPPGPAPVDARDFLQVLVDDGYLDVAVVAGNSLDGETGRVHGARLLGQLARRWLDEGYEPAGFRDGPPALLERTVRLLGAAVRVRIHLTAGGTGTSAARRAVANFTEGLARSDVVVYVGHSNRASGAYFLSEDKTAFSRFELGLEHAGADLARKAPGAGLKRHQILTLHSCSSYDQYCRPLEAFYRLVAAEGGAVPGLIGTARPATFDEFVPRTAALIAGLVAGDGPEGLAARLRAARPAGGTPFLLRGVLQRRRTFVVPPGVTIVAVEPAAAPALGVVGLGDDGGRYPSTEVFPQDRAGAIVQAVSRGPWLYGLRSDGRLLRVGAASGGGAEIAPEARGERLGFVTRVSWRRRDLLLGISAQGVLRVLAGASAGLIARAPPAPARAVGVDGEGRLVSLDAAGGAHAWRRERRAWRELASPSPLEAVAPTLLGGPCAGELRLGLGRRRAPAR